MTYLIADYSVGDEVSSTGEGRHLSFLESELTHPTGGDGFVDGGDPVVVGTIVGVAFESASAATDTIAIDTEGIWCLNVVAEDDNGTTAVAIGDEIYIDGSGVLSKESGDTRFGWALTTSGASSSAAKVIVKVHAS